MQSLRHTSLRLSFVLFVLLVAVAGAEEKEKCSSHREPVSLIGSRPQIILFGDSITEYATESFGWATELAHRYVRKADILNRGFSGYNSAVAWSMVKESIGQGLGAGVESEGKRTLMLVFFGANDATAPDYYMHVPIDEYGENLRNISRRCQEVMPGITLVLVSPPPIDVHKLVEFDWYGGRSLELSEAYAEETARAAQDTGALFLDINRLMLSTSEWKSFLSDGLHLSPIGNSFVAQELLELLRTSETGAQWHPDRMPFHYPRMIEVFKRLAHSKQRNANICQWPANDGAYCFDEK